MCAAGCVRIHHVVQSHDQLSIRARRKESHELHNRHKGELAHQPLGKLRLVERGQLRQIQTVTRGDPMCLRVPCCAVCHSRGGWSGVGVGWDGNRGEGERRACV